MKTAKYQEIQFSDEDVINPDEFIPQGEFNPHNIHPILIHDHGFPVAIVFASHLQDALDIAADEGRLNSFLIEEEHNTPGIKGREADDYPTLGTENEEGITRLGNASEPFDIEGLDAIDLPNPKFSFTALFNATQEEQSK